MKKYLLRSFGLIGIILFVPLFILTFSDPHTVEKSAKMFIVWKLKNKVNEKIDSITLPQSKSFEKLLGDKAKVLRQKADDKLSELKQQLKDDAPSIIAAQIAKIADLDCECRKKWEERLKIYIDFKIASLEKAKEKLIDFTQVKYMDIVKKLTMDVRIFLGVNSLVFIFLFLVSFLKPNATEHLFLPGTLLFLSTAISSYFYLFKQNWFYTILYNDYIGFGYLIYLLIIFAFLSDIVFNKARVTTEIINALAGAIGSTFNVTSC